MKKIRMFFMWPIIVALIWYFLSFEVAVAVALIYLHVLGLSLLHVTETHKEKLVQIVDYIKDKDGLCDPSEIDFENITTADDVLNLFSKKQ